MAALKISVGGEFFDEIRRSGAYYVDKTELLYELAQRTENKVTLFTRPRRFGKTLTMTMIESFFDINRDSADVFRGLAVTEHQAFCQQWMNRVPVLFLTLKDVEGLTFDSAYKMLVEVIANLCKRHAALENDPAVLPADQGAFHRLMYREATKEEIKTSLLTLLRVMRAAYGRAVILLVDEYDVPLAKAQENGYFREMLDLIRGLMSTALKTNDTLQFAVVTGCLRVAKESIFTGVNNFASSSVLDDMFSRYFGFTREEVGRMLAAANLSDKEDLFREWYDGYIFGSTPVYCPWDVICYASDLNYSRSAKPKEYWKNTSGNGIIRAFMDGRGFSVKGKFETLLNGGTVTQTITDQLTYDQLDSEEDHLWSTLLMTGYVTKADPEEDGNTVSLKIPNKEIASIFREAVVRHFSDTADQGKIQDLIDSLWEEDAEKASELLSGFLWDTVSYMDYHEDYYHAFLAGIFVGRGYEVESNKEHGLGRPDILLRDHKHRRAMVIEAKKAESKARMDSACDEALKQIADREYAKGLEMYERVLCYGVAFFRKTARVKRMDAAP